MFLQGDATIKFFYFRIKVNLSIFGACFVIEPIHLVSMNNAQNN